MVNWHLSKQGIRWPLSCDDIMGSSLELIEVALSFLSWLLTKSWFSSGSQAHVRLTCKWGWVVWKTVNANPGLKVNQSISFSCYKCFSLLLCCVVSNSKQKGKQYTENLTAKLQNSDQNFRISWVSLIGLWTNRPRNSAFRLSVFLYFVFICKLWNGQAKRYCNASFTILHEKGIHTHTKKKKTKKRGGKEAYYNVNINRSLHTSPQNIN